MEGGAASATWLERNNLQGELRFPGSPPSHTDKFDTTPCTIQPSQSHKLSETAGASGHCTGDSRIPGSLRKEGENFGFRAREIIIK